MEIDSRSSIRSNVITSVLLDPGYGSIAWNRTALTVVLDRRTGKHPTWYQMVFSTTSMARLLWGGPIICFSCGCSLCISMWCVLIMLFPRSTRILLLHVSDLFWKCGIFPARSCWVFTAPLHPMLPTSTFQQVMCSHAITAFFRVCCFFAVGSVLPTPEGWFFIQAVYIRIYHSFSLFLWEISFCHSPHKSGLVLL